MSFGPDVTFSQQAEIWLHQLATRKRKPIAPATMRAFRSYVRKLNSIILPETKLVDVGNGFVKNLVTELCEEDLSPKTVRELISTVKQVVASAVDSEGEPLFQRTWKASHIDAPIVVASEQRQECYTTEEIDQLIKNAAMGSERVLYAVAAGTGARISEILAIRVNGTGQQSSWDKDQALIRVRSTVFNGKELLGHVKTPAARREVDLDPRLNQLVQDFVELNGIQSGEFLFRARSGRPAHLKTVRERLQKHGLGKGLHAMRRYRVTRLREMGCPESILRAWIGHASSATGSISDVYDKTAEKADLRKQWSQKVGTGFQIPALEHPASATDVTLARPTALAEPPAPTNIHPPYVAEDNDLDNFFHSTPEQELVSEEV